MSLFAFLALASQQTQKIVDADTFLSSIHNEVSKPSHLAPEERIEAEVAAYGAGMGKLSAQVAAAGWMKLLTDYEAAIKDPEARNSGTRLEISLLVTALPDPAAWPIIDATLDKDKKDAHPPQAHMLFKLLLGKDSELIRQCEALRKPSPFPDPDGDIEGNDLNAIELPAAIRLGDTTLVAELLVKTARTFSGFFFTGVPDLVSMYGPTTARPMMQRILEAAREPSLKFNGEQSRLLARSIMVSDIANIKTPQWDLVDGPDRDAWLEKMVAKFGIGSLNENSMEAKESYVGLMVRRGKPDEAVKLLKSADWSDEEIVKRLALDESGLKAMFDAMSKALDSDPAAPIWRAYVGVAKTLGNTAQADSRLNRVLASAKLDPKGLRELLGIRSERRAEADDQRGAVADAIAASKLTPHQEGYRDRESMVALAKATGSREALDAAIAEGGWDLADSGAFNLLLADKRFAEAQQLVLNLATSTGRQRPMLPPEQCLACLAQIYYEADRPQDVIDLLDGAGSWSHTDLFDVLTVRLNRNYRASVQGPPMGLFAGWAFAKTGRKELAIKTLHDTLCCDLDQDESYDLLNEVEGAPALSFYDELIKTDPFGARTLAYKADLLRRLGRLPEAETVARQSVTLNPTDGEERPGFRLRSYEILARILRARGKSSEADRYGQIVKAVRIAEKGDVYRDAGLLPQALEAYRRANEAFAGAYCVQMRMALTLEGEGETDQAVAAMKRAYELMPTSFGEAATFCFGCSGSFEGADRQKLAERTFESLMAQYPKRASIRYLLGQARESAGDEEGALKAYDEAVKLDPRYLNAWAAIVSLGPQGDVSKPFEQEAALTMVRLDPLQLHRGFRGMLAGPEARDYAALWRCYAAARASLPPVPSKPLYPLARPSGAPTKRRDMMMEGRADLTSRPVAEPLSVGPGGPLKDIQEVRNVMDLMIQT